MEALTNVRYLIILILASSLFTSCKEDGEDTPNPQQDQEQTPTETALADEIERQFAFTPNQNFEAIYQCARRNSQLIWHFVFRQDGSLNVLFTTDTYDDFRFDGTYTYNNGQINLQMPAGPQMPFPQGLNENTTLIMPQFGLIAAFSTPDMVCACEGHNLNTQAPPKVQANYDCPNINIQVASDEDNAVEFVHRAIPFEEPVPGSIFRQRDIYVNGLTNPLITRAYGIYRQQGDRFYASFRIVSDFAALAQQNNVNLPFALPEDPPFEDYNLLSGEFRNNGQQVIVDQLQPQEGPCNLR